MLAKERDELVLFVNVCVRAHELESGDKFQVPGRDYGPAGPAS
jgi:hypothetical protein